MDSIRRDCPRPKPNPNSDSRPLNEESWMNSLFEWMVFGETMSFYGVTHDRLAGVVADSECSPCHSLDRLRAGRGRPSDRGLVRPAGNQPGLPQPQNETLAQSRKPDADSSLLGKEPVTVTRDSTLELGSTVTRDSTKWRVKKARNKRDEEGALS